MDDIYEVAFSCFLNTGMNALHTLLPHQAIHLHNLIDFIIFRQFDKTSIAYSCIVNNNIYGSEIIQYTFLAATFGWNHIQ
jgi:hypothetical protein